MSIAALTYISTKCDLIHSFRVLYERREPAAIIAPVIRILTGKRRIGRAAKRIV
jgi:hypothetical protein